MRRSPRIEPALSTPGLLPEQELASRCWQRYWRRLRESDSRATPRAPGLEYGFSAGASPPSRRNQPPASSPWQSQTERSGRTAESVPGGNPAKRSLWKYCCLGNMPESMERNSESETAAGMDCRMSQRHSLGQNSDAIGKRCSENALEKRLSCWTRVVNAVASADSQLRFPDRRLPCETDAGSQPILPIRIGRRIIARPENTRRCCTGIIGCNDVSCQAPGGRRIWIDATDVERGITSESIIKLADSLISQSELKHGRARCAKVVSCKERPVPAPVLAVQ